MAKKEKQLTEQEKAFFAIKRDYTDEDFQGMYRKVYDEIINPFKADLNMYPPDKLQETIEGSNQVIKTTNGLGYAAKGFFGREIKSKKDLEDYLDWWIDFYHQIKTKADFDRELERFERLLYADYQIDMPIIVKFDYQVSHKKNFFTNRPTFYSYWDGNLKTNYGKGSFVIAFCSFNTRLNDEELMAIIKHEFGHIIQGHCTESNTATQEELSYRNQAMDISINLAMTTAEKKALLSATEKMWGVGATGCMSLGGQKKDGGYALKGMFSNPGDYVYPLGVLKYFFPPDQGGDGQGEGGEGGESGEGGGGGEGGGSSAEQINVGDYVRTRTSPPKYGKVVYVDPVSGKADIEEYTDDEWAQIREELKKQKK